MAKIKTWRERMSEDMRLSDFSSRTREGYLAAATQFVKWLEKLDRDPGTATDDDVRDYFLYLRDDKQLAPSSIHVILYALQFLLQRTMRRDLPVFKLLRVNKPRLLPVVLSPAEVRSVITVVREPVRRMALATIYALGLRLNEGLSLETGHIDAERLTVWVRNGKGAKDRGVRRAPMPRSGPAAADVVRGRRGAGGVALRTFPERIRAGDRVRCVV